MNNRQTSANFKSFDLEVDGNNVRNTQELNNSDLLTHNNLAEQQKRKIIEEQKRQRMLQEQQKQKVLQEQQRKQQEIKVQKNPHQELDDSDILRRKPEPIKQEIKKQPVEEIFYPEQRKIQPISHNTHHNQQHTSKPKQPIHQHKESKSYNKSILDKAIDIMDASVKGKPCQVNAHTAVISVNKAKRNVAAMCVVCTIIGSSLGLIGKAEYNNIKKDNYLSDLRNDFRITAVDPNTKRTVGDEYYYYEYKDIYKYMIREEADFDTEVYLAYQILGEHQMNKLFDEGANNPTYNMDKYVKSKGYDSIKEWEKAAEKEILLKKEIREKQNELQKMTNELENEYSYSESYGDEYGK